MDDDKDRSEDSADTEATDTGGETINDPLTRDVDAPRAEFQGRKPEE